MQFDPLKFIETKKRGKFHSAEEITHFIAHVVDGTIPDYQISAWLMAVCFNGLTVNETLALIIAISESGKIFKWDSHGPPVVDKHSTGGVGDTITLIVAPLVAAMGMRMGKHSGRGLGHTGGTIDKLESIPGFTTSLSEKKFRKIVDTVGCAIAGQDSSMTPADGILYSLRDVTATVNQEALIASSIMSKKLAGGAPYIFLDIKVGSGAFMKDIPSAKSLANLMTKIGRACGIKIKTYISQMDAPLGRAVGNALEVLEAIRVMKNDVPPDDELKLQSIEITAQLSKLCGMSNLAAARSRAKMLLSSGAALERFRMMITAQGGDPEVVDHPRKILPSAGKVLTIESPRGGYIQTCDALTIGNLVRDLGGGRKSKSDKIDPSVGVYLRKRPKNKISKGEILCEVHTNRALTDRECRHRALTAFRISNRYPV